MSALRINVPDEPWMTNAACRGKDPELFFPKSGDNGRKAKRICAHCPVAIKCLHYALSYAGSGPRGSTKPNQADHGIFGGTTPWERDRIRKKRRST